MPQLRERTGRAATVAAMVAGERDGRDEGEPLLMKPSECARLANVHPRTITRMVESGELAGCKLRGAVRVNRRAFMELIGGEACE